eukprot:scaffold116841_cov29-Prasinocladus_malaysianus.AAC.1
MQLPTLRPSRSPIRRSGLSPLTIFRTRTSRIACGILPVPYLNHGCGRRYEKRLTYRYEYRQRSSYGNSVKQYCHRTTACYLPYCQRRSSAERKV